MYVHIGVHLRGDETIQDVEQESGEILVTIDGSSIEQPHVTLYLPHADDDAELAISLLQAAIDNAASRVKVRRQKRERAVPAIEEVIGWNGAGASVEAARG